MRRRRLLAVASGTVATMLAGCGFPENEGEGEGEGGGGEAEEDEGEGGSDGGDEGDAVKPRNPAT